MLVVLSDIQLRDEVIGIYQFLSQMWSTGALPPAPATKSKGDIMKIETLVRLMMLGIMVAFTSASAYAQSGKSLTITIAFDFSVRGKTLPAGQYQIARSTQSSPEGLMLRGAFKEPSVFILGRVVQGNEIQRHSKLVFRRYGNEYFLSEVWISGASTGCELPRSRRERQVAQAIEKGRSHPEKISVVATK
jgi:hypothetical protein